MKLVVDEGRYGEENFSRQIAVSSDDTVVLTSDFQRGVRTFDMASGKLISHLEGHTLAGDVYYDPRTELFVTSGDRKIKIWDWRQQKLVKSIIQPFHSQFITHVYVDSKKTYVFAEYAKYSFATERFFPAMTKGVGPSNFDRSPKHRAISGTISTMCSNYYLPRMTARCGCGKSRPGSCC